MARKIARRTKKSPGKSRSKQATKKKAAARRAAPRKAAKRKAAPRKAAPRKAAPRKAKVARPVRKSPPRLASRAPVPDGDLDEAEVLRTEPHESLVPGAESDDLAEELAEEYVESATSGAQAAEDIRDEEVPEETGGPFVQTSSATEFAYDTDGSNPRDAKRAPFPTSARED
jgi:hypothetical protein